MTVKEGEGKNTQEEKKRLDVDSVFLRWNVVIAGNQPSQGHMAVRYGTVLYCHPITSQPPPQY